MFRIAEIGASGGGDSCSCKTLNSGASKQVQEGRQRVGRGREKGLRGRVFQFRVWT